MLKLILQFGDRRSPTYILLQITNSNNKQIIFLDFPSTMHAIYLVAKNKFWSKGQGLIF